MSMSTFIYGIVPPDDTFKKMEAIWEACVEAGVEVPKKVAEFFEYKEPENGILIKIDMACSTYSGDAEDGFEVDLSLVPLKVKVIRFVNSY